MTAEGRRALRQALLDQGFQRVSSTTDDGRGVYTEVWSNGADRVEIRWAPKTGEVTS